MAVDDEALTSALREAVARACELPPEVVSLESPLEELGLDSLAAAEVLTDVEIRLGVEFPVDVLRTSSPRPGPSATSSTACATAWPCTADEGTSCSPACPCSTPRSSRRSGSSPAAIAAHYETCRRSSSPPGWAPAWSAPARAGTPTARARPCPRPRTPRSTTSPASSTSGASGSSTSAAGGGPSRGDASVNTVPASAVGLTLSEAQRSYAHDHALPGVDVRLESWVDHVPTAPYDAVTCIEATEHLAHDRLTPDEKVAVYAAFFERLSSWLVPEGRLGLQLICLGDVSHAGSRPGRGPLSELVRTGIFPEAMSASLGKLTPAWEPHFRLERFEVRPDHYVRTFRAWNLALRAARGPGGRPRRRPDPAPGRALPRRRGVAVPPRRAVPLPGRAAPSPRAPRSGARRCGPACSAPTPPRAQGDGARRLGRRPCRRTTTSRTTSSRCGSTRPWRTPPACGRAGTTTSRPPPPTARCGSSSRRSTCPPAAACSTSAAAGGRRGPGSCDEPGSGPGRRRPDPEPRAEGARRAARRPARRDPARTVAGASARRPLRRHPQLRCLRALRAGRGTASVGRVLAYRRFFASCHAWLVPGGRLTLETIAHDDAPDTAAVKEPGPLGDAVLDLFPESLCPHLAEIVLGFEPWFRARAAAQRRRRLRPDVPRVVPRTARARPEGARAGRGGRRQGVPALSRVQRGAVPHGSADQLPARAAAPGHPARGDVLITKVRTMDGDARDH